MGDVNEFRLALLASLAWESSAPFVSRCHGHRRNARLRTLMIVASTPGLE
jgi:hypothetical protein